MRATWQSSRRTTRKAIRPTTPDPGPVRVPLSHSSTRLSTDTSLRDVELLFPSNRSGSNASIHGESGSSASIPPSDANTPSATSSPIAGARMNPWPCQPAATNTRSAGSPTAPRQAGRRRESPCRDRPTRIRRLGRPRQPHGPRRLRQVARGASPRPTRRTSRRPSGRSRPGRPEPAPCRRRRADRSDAVGHTRPRSRRTPSGRRSSPIRCHRVRQSAPARGREPREPRSSAAAEETGARRWRRRGRRTSGSLRSDPRLHRPPFRRLPLCYPPTRSSGPSPASETGVWVSTATPSRRARSPMAAT